MFKLKTFIHLPVRFLVEILLHPQSRLVPEDTPRVLFYCKLSHGSSSYWVVNGHASYYQDQIKYLNLQGYFMTKDTSQSMTTLTLEVRNVTVDKNDTMVYCSYPPIKSRTALLLIIIGKLKQSKKYCHHAYNNHSE